MSAPETPPPMDPPASLVAALRRLLRPFVRALIEQQVQYPYLAKLLKSLYIEAAQTDFGVEGKRATTSRLALLTGIGRREVKKIRERLVGGIDTPPSAVTLGARVIARWIGDEPWRSPDGRPRRLPRTGDDEREPSFHGLVRSVSADLHPRSLLDEWLRLGVVQVDEQERIGLRVAAFLPVKGYDEKAYYIGRNLRDHVSAAFENLAAPESRFLERSVYYESLPSDGIAELQALAEELGQEALERVNARAREIRDAAAGVGRRRRLTFGVYFYETDADPETTAGDPGDPGDPAETDGDPNG